MDFLILKILHIGSPIKQLALQTNKFHRSYEKKIYLSERDDFIINSS